MNEQLDLILSELKNLNQRLDNIDDIPLIGKRELNDLDRMTIDSFTNELKWFKFDLEYLSEILGNHDMRLYRLEKKTQSL